MGRRAASALIALAAAALAATASCFADIPPLESATGGDAGAGGATTSGGGSDAGGAGGEGAGHGGAPNGGGGAGGSGACGTVCPAGTTCEGDTCMIDTPTDACGTVIEATPGGKFRGDTCGGIQIASGCYGEPTRAILFQVGQSPNGGGQYRIQVDSADAQIGIPAPQCVNYTYCSSESSAGLDETIDDQTKLGVVTLDAQCLQDLTIVITPL